MKKDKINNKNIELMYRRLSKVVLLSVALTGTMVSCQKDSEMEPSQELSQKSLAQETSTLFFKIDGKEYYKKFNSPEVREDFISYLISLTLRGHIITIQSNGSSEYAPEETDKQEIETADKLEIKDWTIKMSKEGYEVEINFDKETGTFRGIATRGGETERGTTAVSTERDTDSM